MHPTLRAVGVSIVMMAAAFPLATGQAPADPNTHQFQKMDARIVWTGGDATTIEVRIEGDLPTTVMVRDSNGNWANMEDADGDFDGDHMIKRGYNVEAGNLVWFHLGWSVPKSFIEETSCAYDHENFRKDCSAVEPPLPPVDLRFDHWGGNEWWVELKMFGSSVESLDEFSLMMFDDQGDQSFMTQLSPGHYGESMRVPIGTRVMFRAWIPKQPEALSCWFVHNSGTEQCDNHKLPPNVIERRQNPDGSWFVWGSIESFEHFKVNEWWVEVQVMPMNNQHWDWQRAQVRVNGGTWKEMTFRSWGAWAVSTHVPAGSLLQFRAYDGIDKAWVQTVGAWTGSGMVMRHHPSLDPAWNVAFANVKGNNWWVQVNPYSDEFYNRVQARVEGGPWRELTFRDWGDWAASFNVPTGKRVQFAVHHEHSEEGTQFSGWYNWPPPS